MDLIETLMAQYGNAPTSIPLNRYVRFGSVDKPRSKSIWVYNLGEMAFYQDFKTDEKVQVWNSADSKLKLGKLNKFQREKYFENLKKEREVYIEKSSIEKYAFIKEEWESYHTPASNNSYFIRKKINVQSDFKMLDKDVLIPMYKELSSREIGGIQQIKDNPPENEPNKKFRFNSQPKASFYPISNGIKLIDCAIIFFVEGYATGYSFNEIVKMYSDSLTWAVIVCFSGHNLENVTEMFRDKFPNKLLMVIADNDDPGIKYATNACGIMKANEFIIMGSQGEDANDIYCRSAHLALEQFCINFKK